MRSQVLIEWLLSVAFTWLLAEPFLILIMTAAPFVAGDLIARACAPRPPSTPTAYHLF